MVGGSPGTRPEAEQGDTTMKTTTDTTAVEIMTAAGHDSPMAISLAQMLDRDARDFEDTKRRMRAKMASATQQIGKVEDELNRNYVPQSIMWIEQATRDLVELKREYDLLADRMQRTIHALTVEVVGGKVAQQLRFVAYGDLDEE